MGKDEIAVSTEGLTDARLAEIKEQCERDEALISQQAFEDWLMKLNTNELEKINGEILN